MFDLLVAHPSWYLDRIAVYEEGPAEREGNLERVPRSQALLFPGDEGDRHDGVAGGLCRHDHAALGHPRRSLRSIRSEDEIRSALGRADELAQRAGGPPRAGAARGVDAEPAIGVDHQLSVAVTGAHDHDRTPVSGE